MYGIPILTHWVRGTHICVSKLITIGSDNGLSPGRHQAIIWVHSGTLLIAPLGTNFNEILIEIQTFSLKKIRLKTSSAKCYTVPLRLNKMVSSYNRNPYSDETAFLCCNAHIGAQLREGIQKHSILFFRMLNDHFWHNLVIDMSYTNQSLFWWVCYSFCFSKTKTN